MRQAAEEALWLFGLAALTAVAACIFYGLWLAASLCEAWRNG